MLHEKDKTRSKIIAAVEGVLNTRRIALYGLTNRAASVVGSVAQKAEQRAACGVGLPIDRYVGINPKYAGETFFGIKMVGRVADLDYVPDLVVIGVPADAVPDAVIECARHGVPFIQIYSAGFDELGTKAGNARKQKLDDAYAVAEKCGTAVAGPNSFGLLNAHVGDDLTFGLTEGLKKGNVGIVSASGGVAITLILEMIASGAGISTLLTVGNQSYLSVATGIELVSRDPETNTIVVFIESVSKGKGPERFIHAIDEATRLGKRVIVFKIPTGDLGNRAALSHTGALVGGMKPFVGGLRTTRAIVATDIRNVIAHIQASNMLIDPNEPLDTCFLLTNAGGTGREALWGLENNKVTIVDLGSKEEWAVALGKKIRETLPEACATTGAMVDVLGDAPNERIIGVERMALEDEHVHALVLAFVPTLLTDPLAVAKGQVEFMEEMKKKGIKKPVIVCGPWTGTPKVLAARKIMVDGGVTVINDRNEATQVISDLFDVARRHKALMTVPEKGYVLSKLQHRRVRAFLKKMSQAGRRVLAEGEGYELLDILGIPTPKRITIGKRNTSQLLTSVAWDLKPPIFLKGDVSDMPTEIAEKASHKTEWGGVRRCDSPQVVLPNAWELQRRMKEHFGEDYQRILAVEGFSFTLECVIGSMNDAEMGPTTMFGEGGTLVEMRSDTRIGVGELSRREAWSVIDETRIGKVFRKGIRGGKAAIPTGEIERAICLISSLVTHYHDQIVSIDINPLGVKEDGSICALDVRVILPKKGDKCTRPIRRAWPVPAIRTWRTAKETKVTLRPIHPSDEPALKTFIEGLSLEDLERRFHKKVAIEDLTQHARLALQCRVDHRAHVAFVAEVADKNETMIIGVARMVQREDQSAHVLNLIVGEKYRRQGLGTRLVQMCVDWAENNKIPLLVAMTEQDNTPTHKILSSSDFTETRTDEGGRVHFELKISDDTDEE